MTTLSIRDIPVLDALLPPDVPVFHCGCCHGFALRFERLFALVDEAPPAVRLPLAAGLALALAGAWSIDRDLNPDDLWPLLCGGGCGPHIRDVQRTVAALRACHTRDGAGLGAGQAGPVRAWQADPPPGHDAGAAPGPA